MRCCSSIANDTEAQARAVALRQGLQALGWTIGRNIQIDYSFADGDAERMRVYAKGARTKSGKPCRSPATKKGRCRLHGGASGSGGPLGKRNGQYRHGERTKAAIAEQQKFSALLKMLRAGVT
jgi:hypothetical protein